MNNFLGSFLDRFFPKFDENLSGGAIQSPKDYRDIPLSAVAGIDALPSSHIEDISVLPVWYQRKLGACVGHASGKYKQYLDFLDTKKVGRHSARFLYGLAKCRDGYSDEGTYPRLVAKILKDVGCATEDTVPNDTTLPHEAYVYNRDEKKIPSLAWSDATKYKISGYAFPNVVDVTSLKRAIVESHGAILLMKLGKEWWTSKTGVSSWASSDVVPLRAPKTVVSGHEVFLYGYETEEKTNRTKFYIFNSWSVNWGKSGCAWFYYDEYRKYLVEAITFTDIPNSMLEVVDSLPSKETFKHSFTKTIVYGQKGAEVTALQTALMIDGVFDRSLYADLLKKGELGYYGNLTAIAVRSFQYRYSIATADELETINGQTVGPRTRKKLNSLFA